LRNTYLLATALVAATAISSPAWADHVAVFGKTAKAFAGAQAHQGPNVHGASITVQNGVITDSSFNPADGGVIDGGPIAPGATSVYASAYQPGGAGDVSFSSSASASASLARGELKATVDNTYNNNFGSPLGFADAQIYDTLYFTNTTDHAIALDVSYGFDGLIALGPEVHNQGGSAAIFLRGCGSCGDIRFSNGAGLYDNRMSFNEGGVYAYDAAPQWTFVADPTGVGGTLFATLLIGTGQTSLGIGAQLALDCRAGTDCFFGHTASLGLGPLADGLSYTSESGVFLTDSGPTGGVPEPGVWALMILGFGGAGAMLRRRNAALA